MDLWQLDATELARLIRVGQASSREAVGACLARMDAVNVKLNAVVRRMDEEALAAADAARAHGDALGPPHGVPVTIKVNTDQKDHPTDNGVVAFRLCRAVFARTWRSMPARLSRPRRASSLRSIRRGEHVDSYERLILHPP
jgi:Asp-tRNA(Asn)/Glu-tRNA(Gln) amidotransferase A subunit family amidase